MANWRYLAYRVHGDGTESQLGELPLLSSPQLTDVLSGPPQATAKVSLDVLQETAEDGQPFLWPWNTAIYAINPDNQIDSGYLVIGANPDPETDEWDLDLAGFSHYPDGQPYRGARYWVGVDPVDLHRHIWDHLQSLPGGNMGVTVDPSASSFVRIGVELENVQFTTGLGEQVNFESGPYKLNWYTDYDLSKKIDDLAKDTPYDWHEEHWWGPGDTVVHFIRIGVPHLGVRRDDLSLVIGENVFAPPPATQDGDGYATTVVMLGAGEGAEMIQFETPGSVPGVRRAIVVEDKTIKSVKTATKRGRAEQLSRSDILDVEEVTVYDHINAPLDAINLGDEIMLSGKTGPKDLHLWMRVISKTKDPDNTDSVVLGLERADLGHR